MGGRQWQQRLDALPQRIGQQAIGQGAHARDHPKPSTSTVGGGG
jgi:hypothetical protein